MDLLTRIVARTREVLRPRCVQCGTTEGVSAGYCSDECFLERGVTTL